MNPVERQLVAAISDKIDSKRTTGSGAEIPDKRVLYVGTHFGNFRIDQLRLVPITGAGKPLR